MWHAMESLTTLVWVRFSHCSVRRRSDSDRKIRPDPISNSQHHVSPLLFSCCSCNIRYTDMFPLFELFYLDFAAAQVLFLPPLFGGHLWNCWPRVGCLQHLMLIKNNRPCMSNLRSSEFQHSAHPVRTDLDFKNICCLWSWFKYEKI